MTNNTNNFTVKNSEKDINERTNIAILEEIFFCLILIWSVCALRTVHFYSNNIGKVTFDSLDNTMWIFIFASTLFFAILRIFIKKPYAAGIYTVFCAFGAVNFTLLVSFFRIFFVEYEKSAAAAIILYFILIISFIFAMRILAGKTELLKYVTKILGITFCALVLFNLVIAMTTLAQYNRQEKVMALEATSVPSPTAAYIEPTAEPDVSSEPEANIENKEPFGLPNVYIIVFDEMASFDMIEKYYGYDCSYFIDFLNQYNFNISQNSFSSETITGYCMTDVLNLDIIPRGIEDWEIEGFAKESVLPKTFDEMGYTQFTTGIWSRYWQHIPNLFSDEGSEMYAKLEEKFGDQDAADVVEDSSIIDAFSSLLAKDVSETKVDADALNEWRFYPTSYIRSSIDHYYASDETKYFIFVTLRVYDFLENPENVNTGYPRVLYSYTKATHVPFVFNEYGGVLNERDERDWQDPNIYLGEYKFALKRLMASITNIIQHDPNCIILVQSDHGLRFHNDCVQKHTMYITNKDSARIVNFAYIKGEKHDIEGLSAINTMRYIMSLYDGYDFPPIEDPITEDSPEDLDGLIENPRHSTLLN